MKPLIIGSKQKLTFQDIKIFLATPHIQVALSEDSMRKVNQNRNFLEKKIQNNETIYGVNTGFGLLSNVAIPMEDLERLQKNLLRSHAVSCGNPIPQNQVRLMLLLRAHNLAQGYSGVRLIVIEKLIEMLNKNITPVIYEQGSVGASGDLAPLAHLALPLIGEGEVWYEQKICPTANVLNKLHFSPISLAAKEGLALINGTQFMTAIGAATYLEAEMLLNQFMIAAAMSLEACMGTAKAFHPFIHEIRPHQGQKWIAQKMRTLLDCDSESSCHSEISNHHLNCKRVQDPYSFRCIPQVYGACKDGLNFIQNTLEIEMNSVTDNPLIFDENNLIVSGGNFHGQPIAMALDYLGIILSEMASLSQERISKLINPSFTELPAFLIQNGGINSGFMMIQVQAASLVSENKTLCHPASVDSIPTSADKEDHVSMGAWAAVKASKIFQNSQKVLAAELMMAAQGIDLLRPLTSTPLIEKVHHSIRNKVKFANEDRWFYPDLNNIIEWLAHKAFFNELCSWDS